MESKTKNRIIGIIVIIGLIIIILPFFLGKKDIPNEPILVKAPPFPDQTNDYSATQSEETSSIDPSTVNQDQSAIQQVQTTGFSSSDTSENLIQKIKPQIVHEARIDAEKVIDNVDKHQIQPASNVNLTPVIKINKNIKSNQLEKNNVKVSSINKNETDSNGLVSLPDAGWVIQIGSFRDKQNALRIVNHLRANGYHAFIQQISTALGTSTRVFVGPENQQSKARAKAKDLEAQLHIHGIVISYKPLSL